VSLTIPSNPLGRINAAINEIAEERSSRAMQSMINLVEGQPRTVSRKELLKLMEKRRLSWDLPPDKSEQIKDLLQAVLPFLQRHIVLGKPLKSRDVVDVTELTSMIIMALK
jgi:hypothetical protein